VCKAHKICGAGQFTKAVGTVTKDTQCVNCDAGTWREVNPKTSKPAEMKNEVCKAHKICGAGQWTEAAGDATTDTKCTACSTGLFRPTAPKNGKAEKEKEVCTTEPCGKPKFKGDGYCDDSNNNLACDYDGGDCCARSTKKGKVQTDGCTECKCLDPHNQGANTCASPDYQRDGNCDDENNNPGCAYDGGDCCEATVKGGVVKKQYCKQCTCVDPKGKCVKPGYKGDGFCDDENNHASCNYDDGDCCPITVKGGKVKKDGCKDCKCLDPFHQGPNTCGSIEYQGDGNCDDENNNAGCAYDKGDCCAGSVAGGKVKTPYCKMCQCLDPKYK